MKIMAINGSPRRAENTARLLHKALEGAASLGAEMEYSTSTRCSTRAV